MERYLRGLASSFQKMVDFLLSMSPAYEAMITALQHQIATCMGPGDANGRAGGIGAHLKKQGLFSTLHCRVHGSLASSRYVTTTLSPAIY